MENAKALGASAICMPASEMTTALSQGAIDAVLSSPSGWLTILGDTGKYGLHAPGMWISSYSIVVDKKWFDGLPHDLQDLISNLVDEVAKTQWAEQIEIDSELYQKLQEILNSDQRLGKERES